MSRVITEDDVIQHMEVPTAKGIFIVGCFERRVTLLSQQVRALNLVYALRSRKRLNKGSRVAVIGGGVAGMTAAAAAAQVGCSVTLLEREQTLLPLLSGNSTRWLHPYIYDWPLPKSEQDEAQLPLLTWKADSANNVAAQLIEQWEELAPRLGIQVCLSAKHVRVASDRPSSPHRVAWNNDTGLNTKEFDAVFLTVGFGLERRVKGIHSASYWEDDSLHQKLRTGKERYLISGCGDGGLVDLLRVRLLGFQHGKTIREFLRIPSLPALKRKLLDIEERSRAEPDPDAYIDNEYRSLGVLEEVDRFIAERLRNDVDVVLNGREWWPLNRQSSVLNRLLVSRLFRSGVHYIHGEFSVEKVGEQYKVQFAEGPPEIFDHVVCRHGPESVFEKNFQVIGGKSRELQGLNRLDQTREPLWTPGFFDAAPVDKTETKLAVPEPSLVQEAAKTMEAAPVLQTTHDKAQSAEPRTPPAAAPETPSTQSIGPVVASPVHEHLIGVPVQPAVSSPAQAGTAREAKSAAQPLGGLGLLLVGAGVLWFLGKGVPPSAPVRPAPVSSAPASSANKVVRTPTNLNSSNGTRSARTNVEDSGSLERVAQGGSRLLSKGVPGPAASNASADRVSPEVVLASGRIDNVQQLRELRQVRLVPMTSGEQLTLDSSPRNVFGFIRPLPNFNYGQSVVSQEQDTRGRSVEVHKLADGQLHLVGYVWEVESRALATGRPVKVSFLPHPSGQSQNLVSVPFSRLRSVKIQEGQGPLVMDLDLGSSTSL